MTHASRGLALLAALAWGGAARAQTSNSGTQITPNQLQQNPTQPPVAEVEHLFGDWGGVRTRLGDLGIDLVIDATAEFAGNVSGGVKQGATSANQIGVQANIDLGKLAGVAGLSTHIAVVNRSGANTSHLFGDDLLPVQEIYGAGGDVAAHLVYAYVQQRLYGDALTIAAGRMPVGNDFAASPLYCTFMNNLLCGNPKALPGGDFGFSAWPDANWGGRVEVRPRPDIYVQAGVYEVNQGIYGNKYFRTGFEFNTSQDSGVILPIEIGYEPRLGATAMPGHYKIGFAYDSSHFDSFYAGLSGPQPAAHVGNTQVWALVDQMVLRNGAGDADGVIVLAAAMHNDPASSSYAEQYTAGVIDRGFWPARPHDAVAILFSLNTVSGEVGQVQGLQSEFGLPFSNGATGIQTREMVFEANYDIHVMRGLNFQPDFQYVFRPNAQGNIHDAAVFGFRAHVTF